MLPNTKRPTKHSHYWSIISGPKCSLSKLLIDFHSARNTQVHLITESYFDALKVFVSKLPHRLSCMKSNARPIFNKNYRLAKLPARALLSVIAVDMQNMGDAFSIAPSALNKAMDLYTDALNENGRISFIEDAEGGVHVQTYGGDAWRTK